MPAAAHSLLPRGRPVFPTSCRNLAWLVARPTPCTRKKRARDAQCKAPIYDGTPSTDPEQRACSATTRLSARSNVQSRGSAPPPARLRACRKRRAVLQRRNRRRGGCKVHAHESARHRPLIRARARAVSRRKGRHQLRQQHACLFGVHLCQGLHQVLFLCKQGGPPSCPCLGCARGANQDCVCVKWEEDLAACPESLSNSGA